MRWVYDRALQRAEQFGIQVIILGKEEKAPLKVVLLRWRDPRLGKASHDHLDER